MQVGVVWWVPLLLCSGIVVSAVQALDLSQCIAPLGMESGAIRDDDISASSSFDSGNVGPQHGRIRTESNGGAWCPKHQITQPFEEWLEIDLKEVHVITAAETQGRFGNGQGMEFAEAFILEYWRPRLGKWIKYKNSKGKEVLPGNANTYLENKVELDPPIFASRVRFVPYSNHRRTVCMRVEIYGCYWSDGIVSYSMPQGDKRGPSWEIYDKYDGPWDGELLRRGLGLLTDGKVGPDNFRFHEKAQGWVGWRNDTRNGQPVEIKFEFDRVREFNAVHIYCNNEFTRDVQVFAEAKVYFSVGGRYFPGEPITYTYIEDRIFETSRNISIKLHHRVGRFVKLQLHFAAKWIMISEVTFDSDIAHGNFSVEPNPPTDAPVQSDVYVEKQQPAAPQDELPVSTAKQDDQMWMAVMIGLLTAGILILIVVVVFARYRHRKSFASPLASKAPLSGAEKGGAVTAGSSSTGGSYGVTVDDNYNQPRGSLHGSLHDRRGLLAERLDDYQEPYQALKYAPYYSYSPVVMEMKDLMKSSAPQSDASYDYAVPELSGSAPLLGPDASATLPRCSDRDSMFSRASSSNGGPPLIMTSSRVSEDSGSRATGKKSPSHHQEALKRRLEQTVVPEFPRHRLRMLTNLAEGAFGKLYVAEADGIPEYGSTKSLGKRFVAVKFLTHNASETERVEFHREVRILAALEDPNIARVLGMCSREEPLCIVLEYLEHGDMRNFLASHVPAEASRTLPSSASSVIASQGLKTLSFNCLLYMATQIASGMRYLETLNFVHRDLATRNCLVGVGYLVKISDFGTDNEAYSDDYYRVEDNQVALPVRWMAWESLFLGKYTTKSDVWSFAVTLWEILTLGRRAPYEHLATNEQMVEQLVHLRADDGQFCWLPRPPTCPRDLYDLMRECWRRVDIERPSFREIHLFLQRKNLGYAPV